MHVRIRQDLPDNQDIFAFPEERQKAQSLSLREGPLLRYSRYSKSGKGGVDNKQRITFRCKRITFSQLLLETEKQTKIP